jgi:hypothetical protein
MPNESFRPARGSTAFTRIDLFGDLRRRLAPGQIFVDGIDATSMPASDEPPK